MTLLVIDASVAASWLFDDESDPLATKALALLDRVEAIVPQLWHFEMRNILLVARRRDRLTEAAFRARLAALPDLPMLTDDQPDLDAALALAERHTLSFYDALYLELAQRRGALLASLDRRLCRTATAAGVALLE